MGRVIAFVYGLTCYLAFFGTILYAIGFTENMVVPKGIDGGAVGSIGKSILINVLLLGAFAIQHSVMARPAFKANRKRIPMILPTPVRRAVMKILKDEDIV